MRISGGSFRGRTLKAPPGDLLRPTQDAVREAAFSMLAAVVPGCSFLDLYAGTGAVGLEAASRGAARVAWVERNPRCLRALEANAAACLGSPLPPAMRVFRADVSAWIRRPPLPKASVDVVFADPPYVEREGDADSLPALAEAVAASGILAPVSFFVAEQRAGTPLAVPAGFSLLASRRYGRTSLSLLRRDAPETAPAPGSAETDAPDPASVHPPRPET